MLIFDLEPQSAEDPIQQHPRKMKPEATFTA